MYGKLHDFRLNCSGEMILLHVEILRAICSPVLRPGAESSCWGSAVQSAGWPTGAILWASALLPNWPPRLLPRLRPPNWFDPLVHLLRARRAPADQDRAESADPGQRAAPESFRVLKVDFNFCCKVVKMMRIIKDTGFMRCHFWCRNQAELWGNICQMKNLLLFVFPGSRVSNWPGAS